MPLVTLRLSDAASSPNPSLKAKLECVYSMIRALHLLTQSPHNICMYCMLSVFLHFHGKLSCLVMATWSKVDSDANMEPPIQAAKRR